MAIFHSYVSLPERKWEKHSEWAIVMYTCIMYFRNVWLPEGNEFVLPKAYPQIAM